MINDQNAWFCAGTELTKRLVCYIHILFTGGDGGNNRLTFAPYVASQALPLTRTEPTIFDQVYSGYRRRPAMISLNVQWVPMNDRSGVYQWNGGDGGSSRKVKTVTFFGTGEMRGQQHTKPVTPPSSDYTDAYLSTFASKPIPTRHIHQLNTSVFANSAPIPLKPTSTPLFTNSSTKTSETRFDNPSYNPTSNSFSHPLSSSSTRNSSYSSSFMPEKRSTTYEPVSTTQYSSPQSQTFTSSYSTLLRSPTSPITTNAPSSSIDSQRSTTTFQSRLQLASSTFPTAFRTETSYDSIYKPMAPYSVQSYPPSYVNTTSLSSSSSTQVPYKPYKPFESTSLSTSSNVDQSNFTERIIAPTPRIEKPIDRPETLLFQHDEDLRASRVTKPSPIFSPSPDTPTIRDALKSELVLEQTDDLSTISSAPIQILENTLNKYDSLIEQISAVLASVSPLSSTVSSMSPGKSVLDYQLSSDSSPILPYKNIENQSLQQSTVPSVSTSKDSRMQSSHLIREDSYDKITTAISDLDTVMISPSDAQKPSTTIQKETQVPSIKEEEKTKSFDDYQSQFGREQENAEVKLSSIPYEENKETKLSLPNEHQPSSVIEKDKEEITTISMEQQQQQQQQVPHATEEEIRTSSSDENQTSSLTEEEEKKKVSQIVPIVDEFKDKPVTLMADEQQLSTSTKRKSEEAKTIFSNEYQILSPSKDKKKEQTTTSSTYEQRIPLLTQEEHIEPNSSSVVEQPVSALIEKEVEETITQDEHAKLGTPLTDEQQVPTSTEIEGAKTISTDENQLSSALREETTALSTDQPQIPSTTQEQDKQSETSLVEEQQVSIWPVAETEDNKIVSADEQHVPLVSKEEEKAEVSSTIQHQPQMVPEEATKDEMTSLSKDEQQTLSLVQEESVISTEEQQVPPSTEKEAEETKTISTEDHQSPSVTKEEETNISSSDQLQTTPVNEQLITSAVQESNKEAKSPLVEGQISAIVIEKAEKEEETKSLSTGQHQIETIPEDEKKEEIATLSTEKHPATSLVEEEKESPSDNYQLLLTSAQEKVEPEAMMSQEHSISSITEEEKEDMNTQSLPKEHETPSSVKEETEKPTITLPEQQETSLVSEELPVVPTVNKTVNEQSTAETTAENTEFVQQQTNLLTNVPNDTPVIEDTEQTSTDTLPSKRSEKHVTWDQTVVDNEDDESSLSQSLSEESSISEPSATAAVGDSSNRTTVTAENEPTVESKTAVDQDVIKPQITSDQTINPPASIEAPLASSGIVDEQPIAPESTDLQSTSTEQQLVSTDSTERQIRPTSPLSTLPTLFNPTNQQIILPNLVESQVNESERQVRSVSPSTTRSPSVTDSSKEDTFTLDEVSTSTSDAMNSEEMNKSVEELDSTKTESKNEGEAAAPHQTVSDADNDNTTKSLLNSLRETITTPLTPLIETIQSVVSSMQTTTPTHPLKNENELIDNVQENTELTQNEENKSTVDTSEESKTMFESLRDAIATPITTIADTIQTAVSNLQSEKQDTTPTSTTEQPTTVLPEKVSTIDEQLSPSSMTPSDEKTDDQTKTSLLDSIQEKVSQTITTLTETIQNVVSTNKSSTDAPTEDELGVAADTVHEEATFSNTGSDVSNITDTTILTSADTVSTPVEQANEKKETTLEESLSSNVPELTSVVHKKEEPITEISQLTTPHIQYDEQVSTVSPVPIEQGDQSQSSSTDISSIPSIVQTPKELASTEDKVIASSVSTLDTLAGEPASKPNTNSSEQIEIEDQQDATLSHAFDVTSVDQKTVADDNADENSSSPIITEQVAEPIHTAAEQIHDTDIHETMTIAEKSNGTITEQAADENTSTETKTTFEVIRDAITHPFATISEKISSIIPTTSSEHTEEAVLSTTKSADDVSKEGEIPKEQTSTETESAVDTEQKTESAETKTTFETIRDVITHPIATITEKIQSVMSSPSSEHVDQTSSDVTKSSLDTSEHIESSEKQPSLETTSTTVIEHKSDSTTESEHHGSSEPKTAFETLRDVITHPLATITEKIQSVISSSTTEEAPAAEHAISGSTVDQNQNQGVTTMVTESPSEVNQDTVTSRSQAIIEDVDDQTSSFQEKEHLLTSDLHSQDQIQGEQEIETTSREQFQGEHTADTQIQDSASNQTIFDTNEILHHTIHDLINDTITSVINNLNEETVSSDSNLTTPIIDSITSDTYESGQSTAYQATITNELTSPDTETLTSDMTWINLVGDKSSNEILNQSFAEIKQLLEEVVQSTGNITVEIIEDRTTITLPNQTQPVPIIEKITQQTIITPQTDDIIQQLTDAVQSDSVSAATGVENLSTTNVHEDSPANTEDDSLELIHALQGHSIIVPSSSPVHPQPTTSSMEKTDEQLLQAPEKSSSSTTTSSQITSSDRYVSYAIHQMGDSSQERLPSFPVAADIPIYQSAKTTSPENKEQHVPSEPIVNVNQGGTKDDDLTELDATENLTSYSDDVHLPKHHRLLSDQQHNLDASSTDEDVDDENFNEFEQMDISNLYRIVADITQPNNQLVEKYEQTYQQYDLSNSSSLSTKPQTDDIYLIPGYPGLWRPSVDDDDSNHSGFAADDEDEKNQLPTTVKTRTIVRTTNPSKLQSFLQQHQSITNQDTSHRPETIDIFNRPLNEFSFDVSESDSFKTCASTINSSSTSKQYKPADAHQIPTVEQQEHQTSPEEKIILIRERERGVSLPVTMKIDYDDMALRLSTSTPIDVPLYSTTETDLPSPSVLSEPIQKTTSSSRASTPSLSSNESEQQKLPTSSWLNTINTITTTTEGPDGPLEARTTIHKSAKGPISIAECDPQGKYIIIENTSRSKSIALSGWTIHQENDNGDILTYTFPDNCLLRSNQSFKVLSKSNETERRNSDLIASSLSSWHTGSNVLTKLINAEGKDRASLTKKTLFS